MLCPHEHVCVNQLTCCIVLQAMHGEVKYQDDIINRVDDKVVKQNDNIRGLSDQARKDHRLGYTKRR